MVNTKWDELTAGFMERAAAELTDVLQLAGHERILDLGPEAHAPDLSVFENATFDAIRCGFGFTLFPDVQSAAKEMYRVLKPGGKIGLTAWNVPEKNRWLANILNVIATNKGMPLPASLTTGMFRCAAHGHLVSLFIEAGFKNIQIAEVKGSLAFPSAEMYWEMMTAVEGPAFAALNGADSALIAKIKYEMFELLDKDFGHHDLRMESNALLLYAEKTRLLVGEHP